MPLGRDGEGMKASSLLSHRLYIAILEAIFMGEPWGSLHHTSMVVTSDQNWRAWASNPLRISRVLKLQHSNCMGSWPRWHESTCTGKQKVMRNFNDFISPLGTWIPNKLEVDASKKWWMTWISWKTTIALLAPHTEWWQHPKTCLQPRQWGTCVKDNNYTVEESLGETIQPLETSVGHQKSCLMYMYIESTVWATLSDASCLPLRQLVLAAPPHILPSTAKDMI